MPVPDVDGLLLQVAPRLPDPIRLSALRGVLWLSAAAGVAGLFGLRRALAREAHAVARERAFLAGVTHELRTPLTTIRVLGETLAEGRGRAAGVRRARGAGERAARRLSWSAC